MWEFLYILSVIILMALFTKFITNNFEKNIMDTDAGWGISAAYICIVIWPIFFVMIVAILLIDILIVWVQAIYTVLTVPPE